MARNSNKPKKDYSVKMSTKISGITSPAQLGRMSALERSFYTGQKLSTKGRKKLPSDSDVITPGMPKKSKTKKKGKK